MNNSNEAIKKAKELGTWDSIDNIPENDIEAITNKIDFIKSLLNETHREFNDFQMKVTIQLVIQGTQRERLQIILNSLENKLIK